MTDAPATPQLAALTALGPQLVHRPGAERYARATRPRNASATQAPAAVLTPGDAEQLAALVAAAARDGARVAVQATGHGAARTLGAESVLIDTGALHAVAIDPVTRTATVGAGARWADVQEAAQRHGLLGCAGTAADVAVSGYTFAGGVGWLTRPHGLASAHLRTVTFVDGTGRLRRASEDAPDRLDREALWAFRGGAPVGVAAELVIGLVDAGDLAAGYALWPAEHARALIAAWGASLDALAPSVTSTIALLALPPDGPFPDELRGRTAVHLSHASVDGEAALEPLRTALGSVMPATLDTTGPCDAQRLATIHLDPPAAVPARGDGRWLSAGAARLAPALLAAARIGADDGLMMAELRHVACAPADVDGALTTPPGPILMHAVGDGPDAPSTRATREALHRVREAAAPVDLGRGAPSFCDGSPDAGDAYPPAQARRLRDVAAALDPKRRLGFERVP